MRFRFLCLCAAGLLVAACATEPEKSSATAGTGVAGSSSTPTAPSLNITEVPAVKPGSAQDWVATVGDRVFFDFDKADISAASIDTLTKQAAWLKAFPQVTLILEGHADERGTREYNLALGDRRANAMKEFLISKGISANRLGAISYGKERPAVVGSNDEAWAQNRRAVGVIKSGGAS
jgi:peptidoglycan-associated lipoprotein